MFVVIKGANDTPSWSVGSVFFCIFEMRICLKTLSGASDFITSRSLKQQNKRSVKMGNVYEEVDDLERELDEVMNPAGGVSRNPSKYDVMKRNNDDIGLDKAVANSGGKFAVCNLSLLGV